MRFNQHGNFNIEFKGNILIVHAFGAWNKETAVSFANQSEILINTVSGLSSWAILADISDWELGVPEIVKVHEFNLRQAISKGCCCEAIVNSTGVVKLDQFNLADPDDSHFERMYFTTKEQAIEWLAVKGFTF